MPTWLLFLIALVSAAVALVLIRSERYEPVSTILCWVVLGFGIAGTVQLTGCSYDTAAVRPGERTGCDPSYEGACLDPDSFDYDCSGGEGNGPDYTGPVTVVGDDHFGLDRDGNGSAC